jgi:hypothetical protein
LAHQEETKGALKLETEGEEATVAFLESLGCSDDGKVMEKLASDSAK